MHISLMVGVPSAPDATRWYRRHRQGGFVDPYGHRWLVGDRSPLQGRR